MSAGRFRRLDEADAYLTSVVAASQGAADDAFLRSFRARLAPALLGLRAMNAHYLEAEVPPVSRPPRRKLLDFVESRCTDEAYQRVQQLFLNERALAVLAGMRKTPDAVEFVRAEKYLYLPSYASSKLATARRLGLHDSPPLTILDLGAGPPHFGLVCEHHGHAYTGLDIPFTPSTEHSKHDLYGELFATFGLRRDLQRIVAFTPLVVSRRYDLVTCLMGIFPSTRSPRGTEAWGWAPWAFFLRDLIDHVMAPRFVVFLQLAREYLDPAVAARLAELGAQVDHERATVRFTDAQADALRAATA